MLGGTSLAPISAGAGALYDVVLMLSALLLGPTLLWMHTVQLTRQLSELSTRDALTRLLNENGLEEALRRHFSRRHHEPMAMMHVDVDQFHRVNDLHGEVAGDDVLRGRTDHPDRLYGLAGNDTLSAAGTGDTLDGGDGDDLLDVGDGYATYMNTYIGGLGNDTLIGSEYADVYIHRLGDGADTIVDHADFASSKGDDELRFEGIASTDMTVAREGVDLTLRHVNGSDEVTVRNWFTDIVGREQIDRIVFDCVS